MTQGHEEWTDEERAALLDLAREEAPPPGAVDRTAGALRDAGLLRGRRPPRRTWLVAAAAAVVAFAGGILIPRRPPAVPADARPQFVVLLYGAEAGDAGERARQVGEIKTWARGLARNGQALSGAKLAAPEYRLGDGGVETSAGLGGYIVLAADGPEQALEIAKTCPHLRHGGRIVVRPVDPT
jgi:hypothetical protein